MNLSFKDRIAFHYMIATAIIIAVVFSTIYFVVKSTVFMHLDSDLSYEAEKHIGEIKINKDSIRFVNKVEWEEREHREIQVNPVFIQLINSSGKLMDKSPNLKNDVLPFANHKLGGHFNVSLNNRSLRQVELPIVKKGITKGYILAAMSSESSESVIERLKNILLISFLVVLIGLYFISRFLAGRGILPVIEITKTIQRITKNNLNERVNIPARKDEIYELSTGFNALLVRIENAIAREKQFTSDASHELRTPLATLRGTLEVLIRKPRSSEEYETKIKYSLAEIDHMTALLEQLLVLARLDANTLSQSNLKTSLLQIIQNSLDRFQKKYTSKKIKIEFNSDLNKPFIVHQFYSQLIIDNILDNAFKYSSENSIVKIQLFSKNEKTICQISDNGIGIKEEDLHQITQNFFRSNSLNHKHIKGNGLGLSIAKKAAEAMSSDISITSTLDIGTSITLVF